jgi:septal ring factor EnvC (AmiA/AmiB activator)
MRYFAAASLLIALLAPPPAAAPAAGPSKADRDAKVKALKAESESLSTQKKSLLGELRRLEVERQIKAGELEENTAKLEAVTGELTQTSARLAETERDLAQTTPAIRERLVRIYKLGRLGYTRLLLSLDSARTFQQTARVVSLMAQRDRGRIDHYRQLISTDTIARKRLTSEKQEAQRLEAQIQTDQRAVAQAMAVRNAMVKSVEEQRGLNTQLMAELSAATDRLSQSVGKLGSTVGGGKLAGKFDWPLAGALQTRFGKEVSSRFGTMIARNGVEIAATEETPVKAASDGKVVYASTFTGFGQLVILDHGGRTFTLYGHLRSRSVQQGESVARGQVVGTSGVTPTGGPAVYFELRIDGKPVDPVQWLKR